MDPDCAICRAPATVQCDCEAKGLESAVKQAEDRMMRGIYNDIRGWVRAHAQDYILEYFRLLTERRKLQHQNHLDHLTQQAYHYYHAPPHPSQLDHANAALKRGVDEDWQASVQRYPEVLEYFYSLVELSLPSDDEPAVKDPPLSALNGSRKTNRRSAMGSMGGGSVYHDHDRHRGTPLPRGRTPPVGRIDGRTTAPPMGGGLGPPPPGARRMPYRGPPPPGVAYYPGPPY
ncbi:hypothetical protein JX265_000010 [Neoarthrinium moseri]|uniref:Uncharacterized protein n=1 Tax=Neoarthrinium moseri TaxID=1658444 RepID=A0A9P9WXM1_9PEZI|nr:uncharacterized protein JN550_001287 [Neoarthrinium moseri]KAI1845811.1 hypothetical protein JX266_008176 [Neoarthrinium moseri]KAI1877215.1 hypothetical protein JN550_001287 [Neoarthrinium moseri]KAI1881184.1 hypothetical protein JX265_000010 [Neoarthrinium moseri]